MIRGLVPFTAGTQSSFPYEGKLSSEARLMRWTGRNAQSGFPSEGKLAAEG